jgi:uncharacterized protein DUF2460
MAEFPRLKTGAIAQYPATRTESYDTTVMRFIDGSEQRFRNVGRPLRTWLLRLDLLDEAELHELEQFFAVQRGSLDDFAFTDPWDETQHPSCRLEEQEFVGQYLAEHRGMTRMTITENL